VWVAQVMLDQVEAVQKAHVAALDIGKAEIVCCIRLPAVDGGHRVQEVSMHSTMVTSLCELANRLVGLGVERVS
jgi:transposase